MIDGPTAGVIIAAILGVSGTIVAALIQYGPRRKGGGDVKHDCVKHEQHSALADRVTRIEGQVGQSDHTLPSRVVKVETTLEHLSKTIDGVSKSVNAVHGMVVKLVNRAGGDE